MGQVGLAAGGMRVALLGALEVTDGTRSIELTGVRLGRLLTRLAVDADRPVPASVLAAAVWGAELPADPVNSLQSLVSRLRRALGNPAVVVQTVAGYRLAIDPDQIDLHRFGGFAVRGRRLLSDGDPAAALSALTDALRLWRADGPAFPESFDGIEHWSELQVNVVADLATASLALDRGVDVIPELESALTGNPFREDLVRLLMRALQAAGRSSEALALYEAKRQFLADQLGIDPSPETQAVHLELLRGPATPPAQSTYRRRSTNLRADVSSFIGRSDEIARIDELLLRSRLVTVLGPGGVGKTRLAGRTGSWVLQRYPDGVWMVELAAVTEASGILQAMLSSIGVRDARVVDRNTGDPMATDPIDRLTGQLEHAKSLLILDNCEHLIDAVADVVDQLLARCSSTSVLATSREPLNIAGESLAVISPLGLPTLDPLSDPGSTAAVQLFVERAAAVSPGFQLDATTSAAVVSIVRRLDGLPLAIELAAARLRVLPLAEIESRLSDRFRLLTGGSRTALPRHRTLRAVVEWSWDLLTKPERLLAERLAVFPSGATAESATAVTADDMLPAVDIPDLLGALVDKSLLQVVAGPATRYRMLETIREFGIEVLAARGEVHAARAAHAGYFRELAAGLEPQLRTAHQLAALSVLVAEQDNLLAALRYLTDSGTGAEAIELARSLLWFWVMTGRHAESVTVLDQVLQATADSDDPSRIYLEATLAMSSMAAEVGDTPGSWQDAGRQMRVLSDRLAQQPPDDTLLGIVLGPVVALFAGLAERGQDLVARALESPDPWVRGTVRSIRLNFLENEGRVAEMRADVELAYADFEGLGDRWGLSNVLTVRARLRTIDGDLVGAAADYQRALDCVTELQTSDDDMLIMLRLADVMIRTGDFAGARRLAQAVLATEAPNPMRSVFAGTTLAMVTLWEHGPQEASRQIDGLRQELALVASSIPIQGHLRAIALAATSYISVQAGDLEGARRDLDEAHPIAAATTDYQIIATVGVSTAAYAAACGKVEIAAQVLGASWTLRGSEDPTDVAIAQLTGELVTALGATEFEQHRDQGRALAGNAAIARLDPGLL